MSPEEFVDDIVKKPNSDSEQRLLTSIDNEWVITTTIEEGYNHCYCYHVPCGFMSWYNINAYGVCSNCGRRIPTKAKIILEWLG